MLTYTERRQPECTLATGQPSDVRHGESIEYACVHSVQVTGTNVVPNAVSATWTIQAAVGGGWSVSLLPPDDSPGTETPQWTQPGAQGAFTFNQAHPIGVGQGRGSVDSVVEIGFRLRVHRAVCSETGQQVQLTHASTFADATQGATVTRQAVDRLPENVSPGLVPIPDPTVSFNGPLAFGRVGVTADGPAESTMTGSVSLAVSGLDDACGTWRLALAASDLIDGYGQPLQGSQLMVVSVNNEPLPDGACDLAATCDLLVLATGPNAAPSPTVVLGIELRMPDQPGLGSFGTSLDATLIPTGGE